MLNSYSTCPSLNSSKQITQEIPRTEQEWMLSVRSHSFSLIVFTGSTPVLFSLYFFDSILETASKAIFAKEDCNQN